METSSNAPCNGESFIPPLLSPSQVFNQTAFRAKSDRELTDGVASFLDCSIVIPPTEIQDEAMLSSIIGFQKKLLQDRFQSSDRAVRLDAKPRRGERCRHTHTENCSAQ